MKNLWSPDLYQQAWHFASIAHSEQSYGNTVTGEPIPYLNHVANVAMEVCWAAVQTAETIDTDLAVQCALLHDVIEDTETTEQQLAAIFGTAVAAGVMALTKDDTLPKERRMQDALERILSQPKEIAMVKLADRIVNLSAAPLHWDKAKMVDYKQEAKLIHEYLAEANPYLAERLEGKISAYANFFPSP